MIIRKSYLNQRSRKQKTGHCSHVDINHLLIIPSIFQRPPNSHPWWGLEPHPGCVSMKPKKNENTNCHLKSWSTILNIIKLYNLHYISYQYISVNIIKLYFIIYIYQISRVIIYIYQYSSKSFPGVNHLIFWTLLRPKSQRQAATRSKFPGSVGICASFSHSTAAASRSRGERDEGTIDTCKIH